MKSLRFQIEIAQIKCINNNITYMSSPGLGLYKNTA